MTGSNRSQVFALGRTKEVSSACHQPDPGIDAVPITTLRKQGVRKAFTLNSGKREARNLYVWESEDAAKAFFTDELLERVTSLYDVRPTVEFVQIAALVENVRA